MSYSLQSQFSSIFDTLKGARVQAFQNALNAKLQKRDYVWLPRLIHADVNSKNIETPDGWEIFDGEFQEIPSYKNEQSVFYHLQHALYHVAFVFSIPARKKQTIQLPTFDPSVWPLLIIEIGEAAEVVLIDDQALPFLEEIPFRSVVVRGGVNSKIQWRGYQHHDPSMTSFDHKLFILEDQSKLQFYHHVVGGRNSYDETVVELLGRDSEAFSQTVFFGHGDQQQEMRFNHVHVGMNTKSHMISKGAVQDRSHGSFLGSIQMERGCSGADGMLEEHNLLLSRSSKIDAIPALEIGHHDVKAGHSAYMERVDEEKLFYLASRGIPEEQAIELILEGFFWDAIQKMGDEKLAQLIFDHILSLLRSGPWGPHTMPPANLLPFDLELV